MAMHVLQLGPYPPPEGGVSRNMLAIRDEVVGRGDQCSIIATTRSSSIDGAPDVFHPDGPLALIRLLASIKFDVLHLHVGGDINARVMGLAAAAAFFGRDKCVLTLHSGQFPLSAAAANARPNSIRGRIFNRFSKIIAVSDPIANVFRRYGVPSDRLEVVVPFEPKLPDPAVKLPPEMQAFVDRHSPLILSVGGLEPDYDPIFQIEAFRGILAEFPDAGLMIVGEGSMRPHIESEIRSCEYGDRIHLAGNVEHDNVLHLINVADTLIRTTLFDGDAISVRESLFLGTPVVATDTGDRPEGTRIYKPGDIADFLGEVRSAVTAEKIPLEITAPQTSNIQKVLSIYDHLLRTD